jgi:peptidoglycan hydrolase-like protein with peptidoglycan-binding domain
VPVGAPDQSAIDRWNDGVRARARELLPFLRELPDLWPGAADLHVVRLQQGLNLVTGARLVEDGRYGARTAEAVRNFQRFFSLHVDGITGSPTRFFLILSTQKLTELP